MSLSSDELVRLIYNEDLTYEDIFNKLDQSDIETLITLADSKDTAIASRALSVLSSINSPAVLDLIIKKSNDENPILRLAAAYALKPKLPSLTSILPALALSQDKDKGVKKAMLNVLSEKGFKKEVIFFMQSMLTQINKVDLDRTLAMFSRIEKDNEELPL